MKIIVKFISVEKDYQSLISPYELDINNNFLFPLQICVSCQIMACRTNF